MIYLLPGVMAQTETASSGNIDIMVIDSFITPETPNKFVLSFFTSEKCSSKIIVKYREIIIVSENLTEDHKLSIDLKKINAQSDFNYQILVYDSTGAETRSELFEVRMSDGFVIPEEENPGLFSICLGAVVFAIPSPVYVIADGKYHWSLNKEIPLINFYSAGYNYPSGYFSIGYSHIFDTDKRNFLRLGYKQVIRVEWIKYIAPGLEAFTDLKGFNGLSTELSFGLFQIQNVFTFYAKYRYNFQLIANGRNFQEISVGLYSNFFSLNL